jgi:hypothetical protein
MRPTGACPLNPDGTTSAPGDVDEQARVCVDDLEQALADADASASRVPTTHPQGGPAACHASVACHAGHYFEWLGVRISRDPSAYFSLC